MTYAPSEDSDQPGHPPSLIRVFAVRLKKPLVLSYTQSTWQRLIRLGGCPVWSVSLLSAWRNLCSLAKHRAPIEDWSDWVDAQADLSLRWAHKSFCWFCHVGADFFSTLMILHKFSYRQVYANSVDPDQRLPNSLCIFQMHYCRVTPHRSNFRRITGIFCMSNFSGIWTFRSFMVILSVQKNQIQILLLSCAWPMQIESFFSCILFFCFVTDIFFRENIIPNELGCMIQSHL